MKRVALLLTVITMETISSFPLIISFSGDSNHLGNQFLIKDLPKSDSPYLKLAVTTGQYKAVKYQRNAINFKLHFSRLFTEWSWIGQLHEQWTANRTNFIHLEFKFELHHLHRKSFQSARHGGNRVHFNDRTVRYGSREHPPVQMHSDRMAWSRRQPVRLQKTLNFPLNSFFI